jgi:hypothetical protein
MCKVSSLVSALLLVVLLPWCGVAGAFAAQPDDVQSAAVALMAADAEVPVVSEPAKQKRTAFLSGPSCSPDAPVNLAGNDVTFAPSAIQPLFREPALRRGHGSAPPTSPPRTF